MNRKLPWLSTSLGLLLAIVIVFVQFNQFDTAKASTAKAKTEQTDGKTSDTEIQISLPSFSLPSPVHVAVNLDAICLFEIVFEDNEPMGSVVSSTLFPQKFLTTLFRVIIAPNAP